MFQIPPLHLQRDHHAGKCDQGEHSRQCAVHIANARGLEILRLRQTKFDQLQRNEMKEPQKDVRPKCRQHDRRKDAEEPLPPVFCRLHVSLPGAPVGFESSMFRQRDQRYVKRPVLQTNIAVLLVLLIAGDCLADLTSGQWKLSGVAGQPIKFNTVARVTDPLAVDVIDSTQKITHSTGYYSEVNASGDTLTAKGSITCGGGSVLDFVDLYTTIPDRGSFALSRTVTVHSASSNDAGFRTEYAVQADHANRLAEVQPFVPGMWYCDAAHVPPSGLISNPDQRDYLFREDRLPMPMAMLRDKSTGLCLTIIHDHPDGATFADENTRNTIIDDRMKFASLGVRQQNGLSVVLAYPGVEGDQTRIGGNRNHQQRAERFHPVRQGFSQNYRLVIHLSKQPDFDNAMRDAWRMGYDTMAPEIVTLPMDKIYASSIHVLDHHESDHNGVPGFPFAVELPSGRVRDVSYQMGFVGEQLPCAYHLITAGFAESRPELVTKGERIVDFWAANTLSPQGVPRTWYDRAPGKSRARSNRLP
jgi:hypothetical protein